MKNLLLLLSACLSTIIVSSCSNFSSISEKDKFIEDSLATVVKTEAIINELLEIDGMRVRCYQPKAGNARWTINSRIPK